MDDEQEWAHIRSYADAALLPDLGVFLVLTGASVDVAEARIKEARADDLRAFWHWTRGEDV